MTLSLLLIGAGEYISLEEPGASQAYLRFRSADGRTMDLPASAEQINSVLSFGSGNLAVSTQPATSSKSATAPQASPTQPAQRAPVEDLGDPNIVSSFEDDDDDDESPALYLSGSSARSSSPFLGRADPL